MCFKCANPKQSFCQYKLCLTGASHHTDQSSLPLSVCYISVLSLVVFRCCIYLRDNYWHHQVNVQVNESTLTHHHTAQRTVAHTGQKQRQTLFKVQNSSVTKPMEEFTSCLFSMMSSDCKRRSLKCDTAKDSEWREEYLYLPVCLSVSTCLCVSGRLSVSSVCQVWTATDSRRWPRWKVVVQHSGSAAPDENSLTDCWLDEESMLAAAQ